MIELLDLKIDVVFKSFFGDKNSKEFLESFVNSVLGLEGKHAIQVETLSFPSYDRTPFPEVSLTTTKGDCYIIKMQAHIHEGFDRKLLYHLVKNYTECIDLYPSAPISTFHMINIFDDYRFEEKSLLNGTHYLETYSLEPESGFSDKHLFDQWKVTILDLKKFGNRSLNELKTTNEKWLHLLKNAPCIIQEEANNLKKEPIFKHALKRLEDLSLDPSKQKAYKKSLSALRDYLSILASERAAGYEEGCQEERLDIAQSLSSQGVSPQQVCDATGVSMEEIDAIRG